MTRPNEVDHELLNTYTSYYRADGVDFLSEGGPLRAHEVENNPAEIDTSEDKGSIPQLTIPSPDAKIWKEWQEYQKRDAKMQPRLGESALREGCRIE